MRKGFILMSTSYVSKTRPSILSLPWKGQLKHLAITVIIKLTRKCMEIKQILFKKILLKGINSLC